ncbi:MAG: pyridoxal phosphate-dependent aminotransferase [Candidatus Thermoplasmatota archaeon]|nr:pyridoxal phosphate-dependent aminotransferase [Candidatus Thermoplasmatota archaeon]
MVSERVSRIEESSTVKSASTVAQLKKKGINVISFGMGEPDFTTPRNIIEAAERAMERGFTHYTPTEGIPELREAIAEKSKRENGIECGAENVLVMPSKFAIFAAMFALLDCGDGIILPDPGWQTYSACASLCGSSYFGYSSVEGIEQAIKRCRDLGKKPKLIVLNSPSNPAGKVFSRKEIEDIAGIAEENDLFVLSDEVYEKLIYEGKHISIGNLLGEKAITVNGFSKTYAMTGWRVGWCIAYGELFEGMKKIAQHTQTCATSFAQFGALEALKGTQDPVKNMKEEFRKRRDFICKALSGIDVLKFEPPAGMFYLFPSYALDMNSEDFCSMMLEEAHVLLTPGSAFGKNGERRFRLSYATSMKNLEEGAEKIGETIERYISKKF